ncbi:thiol:disulfide interchange protein DsbA/DsbL [Luteimonas terrae]|uniref:Thiol:disulfide interchange protein DsbA n=1 Tax=Luteimonas terrae TaxID=1530191 RepID=A0ABU1XUF8_9GAMM|nr:thiol:disulfide interchange protein DsbA/DsbL [Luteimonas terrae]MDR7191855.1 thiol:disulfide interchange protein DsbA [Luteimonas terrae]
MKIRHTLLLMLAPVLLMACSQQPDPAAAPDAAASATPAQTAPAAPADAAPVGDAAAPTDPQAESPAANSNPVVAPQGPAPVAGTDYVEIQGGQPFANASGQIEVAEVFAYWCGHCASFEPLINAWKARLPGDVNFVALPAVFDERDNFPRAFFASETMGTLARTHDATFNAIHIEKKLRPNADAAAIAAFYGTLGIDQQRFTSTMQSFAVNANLGRARQFATRSGVDATPTIIVNGKYRVVSGRSLEDILRVTDHLVAMERAAQ